MPVLLFETALGEIASNVLVHALPDDASAPSVEYRLLWDGATVVASFTDHGPPLHNQLTPAMPSPTDESGRGLAIAKRVLDELVYERTGEVNTWRLVKRL